MGEVRIKTGPWQGDPDSSVAFREEPNTGWQYWRFPTAAEAIEFARWIAETRGAGLPSAKILPFRARNAA